MTTGEKIFLQLARDQLRNAQPPASISSLQRLLRRLRDRKKALIQWLYLFEESGAELFTAAFQELIQESTNGEIVGVVVDRIGIALLDLVHELGPNREEAIQGQGPSSATGEITKNPCHRRRLCLRQLELSHWLICLPQYSAPSRGLKNVLITPSPLVAPNAFLVAS